MVRRYTLAAATLAIIVAILSAAIASASSDNSTPADVHTEGFCWTLTLAVSPLGGGTNQIQSVGQGACGTGGLILEGLTVTLIEAPSPGYHFLNWSGDACSGTASTTAFQMPYSFTCTANFAADLSTPRPTRTPNVAGVTVTPTKTPTPAPTHTPTPTPTATPSPTPVGTGGPPPTGATARPTRTPRR